jgi:phosphate/sulfate permease
MQTKQTGFHKKDVTTRDRRFIRFALIAGVFFFLGFSSLITGFALTIIHAIVPNDVTLNTAGTVFIFISIPLLLIGSYLLDLSGK